MIASFVLLTLTAAVRFVDSYKAIPFNASFEDLKPNPVLPLLNPVPTPENGLAYNNFNSRSDDASILKAHSRPIAISAITLNDQLKGNVSSISSSYTNSKVAFFDLNELYIGCAITTEASLGVPQACTVQFVGKNGNRAPVTETCTFGGGTTLVLCQFRKLKQVVTVNLLVVKSTTTPLTTVAFLDNVAGLLYPKA